ncbi:hypothetical protein ABIA16_004606 [Sinorhizobium fredii]
MLGRGFPLGVTVGCVLGVYMAPHLGSPKVGMSKLSDTILPQANMARAIPEKATWPTDDQAKIQLFELSKWDLSKHGKGSKVSVDRCIRIAETEVACAITAQLGWDVDSMRIESVFQAKSDGWKMIAAKKR